MPRYLAMIRIDERALKDKKPSAAMMERMGKLLDEMRREGVLLDTAGLAPTARGKRVHWKSRRLSFTDGPFTESKEVVGGYLMLQAADQAAAVEWAKRFLELHQDEFDLSCEVRQLD